MPLKNYVARTLCCHRLSQQEPQHHNISQNGGVELSDRGERGTGFKPLAGEINEIYTYIQSSPCVLLSASLLIIRNIIATHAVKQPGDRVSHRADTGPDVSGFTAVVSQAEERLSIDSVRRHESDFSLCTPNYLSSSISKNKFIFHKASFASATPPPLPNCLRAIRCHFDHGYLAKGEKEREREKSVSPNYLC